MTKLTCSVTNCINNSQGLCRRSDISVDGNSAKKSSETFCHSFNHRTNSMQNSIAGTPTPDEKTEVECTACHCVHNNECKCNADSIEVCGKGACRCGETECSTFSKK